MLGRGADGLHAHGALHAVRVVDEVRHVELAADARQIEQLRLGLGFGFEFGFGLALGLGLGWGLGLGRAASGVSQSAYLVWK